MMIDKEVGRRYIDAGLSVFPFARMEPYIMDFNEHSLSAVPWAAFEKRRLQYDKAAVDCMIGLFPGQASGGLIVLQIADTALADRIIKELGSPTWVLSGKRFDYVFLRVVNDDGDTPVIIQSLDYEGIKVITEGQRTCVPKTLEDLRQGTYTGSPSEIANVTTQKLRNLEGYQTLSVRPDCNVEWSRIPQKVRWTIRGSIKRRLSLGIKYSVSKNAGKRDYIAVLRMSAMGYSFPQIRSVFHRYGFTGLYDPSIEARVSDYLKKDPFTDTQRAILDALEKIVHTEFQDDFRGIRKVVWITCLLVALNADLLSPNISRRRLEEDAGLWGKSLKPALKELEREGFLASEPGRRSTRYTIPLRVYQRLPPPKGFVYGGPTRQQLPSILEVSHDVWRQTQRKHSSQGKLGGPGKRGLSIYLQLKWANQGLVEPDLVLITAGKLKPRAVRKVLKTMLQLEIITYDNHTCKYSLRTDLDLMSVLDQAAQRAGIFGRGKKIAAEHQEERAKYALKQIEFALQKKPETIEREPEDIEKDPEDLAFEEAVRKRQQQQRESEQAARDEKYLTAAADDYDW